MNIAVFYLAWIPYGIEYFETFLINYIDTPAGHPHKLVIILNGISLSDVQTVDSFERALTSKKITNCEIIKFDTGQDIDVYDRAAALTKADFFLFLNTFSHFEHKNWLSFYVSNWNCNVGLIGSTASYATYLSAVYEQTLFNIQRKKSLSLIIRSLKYLLKISLLNGRNFKKFPAPHIRTNAFFTSKKIWGEIGKISVKSKMEAYYFENGKRSLTDRVIALGYNCIVIDKYGRSFQVAQWHLSKTFWIDNQENLLISDNQTTKYNQASFSVKQLYNRIAWKLSLLIFISVLN